MNVCRPRRFFLHIVAGLVVAFLLVCPLFSLPVLAQTGSIRFENISTEQVLPQSTVNAIIPDRQGLLWFATEGGLNRWDGYPFTLCQYFPAATNEDRSVDVQIMSPFWQSWWFIILLGIVLGAGAFGVYRLRVREIEARSQELARQVEQRTHELSALNTISSVVNSSLDLTEILNSALRKTIEVMHMDAGLAFSLEEASPGIMDEPYIRLLAHQGVSEEHARLNQIVPLRTTLVSKAIETGRPLISYGSAHPNAQVQASNTREGIGMSISIPLLVKGKLVGTLAMASHEPREITADELSLLEAIGRQVGMAVVNARMYEQAEQTAIATERSRLARELHDSVTQLLYSVGLYAEAASELLGTGDIETAASHLHELRDTAQEALREMRLLIFELHRPAIGDGGLVEALLIRLDAVERRGGMHAELAVDGHERIPRPIQEELYNIAREALNNALKHAHANSIRIQLRFGEMDTGMEIHDDGLGFEPAEDGMNGGFGIQGMRERCQKINGTLQIISVPGEGTTVLARVPFPCPEYTGHAQNEPPREKWSLHA